MNGRSVILASSLLIPAVCDAQAQERVRERAFDPVITSGEALTMPAFGLTFRRTAGNANITDDVSLSALEEFARSHPRRIVPRSEWRPFFMEFFYRSGVASSVAEVMLERLSVNLPDIPVDTGFLEEVRTVDLPSVFRSG